MLLRIILHPTLKLTCDCDHNGVEDDYECFHTGRQDVFIEEEIDCHANLLDQRQTKIVSHHRSLKQYPGVVGFFFPRMQINFCVSELLKHQTTD